MEVDKANSVSTTPATGEPAPEQQAIERLKAGEPKYACVGCSA